jgi:UPF0716 family protein affecting phage T7 exclusion
MNAHIKTILTIVGAIVVMVIMGVYPVIAYAAWIGLWIVIGCAFACSIYGLIWMTYSGGWDFPEQRIRYAEPHNIIGYNWPV